MLRTISNTSPTDLLFIYFQAEDVRARANGVLLHLHAPIPDLRLPASLRGRVVACHRQLYALARFKVSTGLPLFWL